MIGAQAIVTMINFVTTIIVVNFFFFVLTSLLLFLPMLRASVLFFRGNRMLEEMLMGQKVQTFDFKKNDLVGVDPAEVGV